jgi:hypothetical protein
MASWITAYLRRISAVQNLTIFVAGVGSFDIPVPASLAALLRLNLHLQHGLISYVGALNSGEEHCAHPS